jgi:hypothetical protein
MRMNVPCIGTTNIVSVSGLITNLVVFPKLFANVEEVRLHLSLSIVKRVSQHATLNWEIIHAECLHAPRRSHMKTLRVASVCMILRDRDQRFVKAF